MNDSEKGKFATILTGIAELYGRDASKVVMSLFWESLKEFDFDAVSAAFSSHVQSPDNGQYFPKPADIIRLISGTSKDAAFIAWSKVEKAVQRVGPYQSVVFDDPIIHLVLAEMGGWIILGEKTDKEWPFVRNEFVTRYQAYKSQPRQLEHQGKLVGIHESNNRQKDYDIDSPVLIGDKEKASLVLAGGSDKQSLEYHSAGDIVKQITDKEMP